MANSKNIDRLFKEKFKEFEATAPSNTWDNIQDSITKSNQNAQVKTATANNLYSTIFYVTASCFFITLTVALSTYAYITIKQDQAQTKDAVVTLVDQTTNRKKQVIFPVSFPVSASNADDTTGTVALSSSSPI